MKKQILANDAAKLYIEKLMTLENIAKQLNVNERTLSRWKAADDWDIKRAEFLKTHTTFHEDLYNFGRGLLKSIQEAMANGKNIEPSRMQALTKIMTLLKSVKIYEDKITNEKHMPESPKPEGLTPKVIREIEEKILGITYDD